MARLIIVMALGAGASVIGGAWAVPAAAHTALEDSTPEDGARVSVAPDQVVLDFTEPVRSQLTRVSVRGPSGDQFELGGPQSASDKVTQSLRPLGAAGKYEIVFRIVSADGHPVAGSVRFTLTRPGPAASASTAASQAPAPPANPGANAGNAPDAAADNNSDDGDVSPWVLGVMGIGLVAFVGGAVWFGRRLARDVD